MVDMNKTLYEVTNKLFVKSLVNQINYVLDPDADRCETSVNKVHTLSHLFKTLEYFTSPSDFDRLTKHMKVKIKPKSSS